MKISTSRRMSRVSAVAALNRINGELESLIFRSPNSEVKPDDKARKRIAKMNKAILALYSYPEKK